MILLPTVGVLTIAVCSTQPECPKPLSQRTEVKTALFREVSIGNRSMFLYLCRRKSETDIVGDPDSLCIDKLRF